MPEAAGRRHPVGAARTVRTRIERTPLRVRVAAAFAVTTAVAIAGLGVFVTLRVEQTLVDQTRSTLASRTDALLSVSAERRAELVTAMTGETFAQVVTREGEIVAGSARLGDQLALPRTRPAPGAGSVLFQRDVLLSGEDERERVELLATLTDGDTLVVGTSRENVEEATDQVVTQLLVAGPLALLAATLLGYGVAGAALAPVDRMRARAESISASTVGDRLPLPSAEDELHRLGATLNQMLDRLEASLARERRFVAEASHELRTPLALLRLELDLASSRPRTPAQLQETLVSVQEEVARLSVLAEDLLVLGGATRRDGVPLPDVVVDLAAVAADVVERFAGRARSEGRTLTVQLPEAMPVRGDATGLERIVANLLDNALRHGAGAVSVTGTRHGDEVDLVVTDAGSDEGPLADASWFDAFSRSPRARSSGHGLGLPIVRALAEQHGGVVEVVGEAPGTSLRVRLPAPGQALP